MLATSSNVFETSSLEVQGVVRRGEQYVSGPCTRNGGSTSVGFGEAGANGAVAGGAAGAGAVGAGAGAAAAGAAGASGTKRLFSDRVEDPSNRDSGRGGEGPPPPRG